MQICCLMDTPELVKVLKQKRIISADVVASLQNDPKAVKGNWEDLLVEKGSVTEEQLLQVKSELLGIPVVDLRTERIDQEVLQLVPEPIAHRHKIISFAKTKEGLH